MSRCLHVAFGVSENVTSDKSTTKGKRGEETVEAYRVVEQSEGDAATKGQ